MIEDGQRIDIDEVVIHPDYEQTAYQDIAVVKLEPSQSKLS